MLSRFLEYCISHYKSKPGRSSRLRFLKHCQKDKIADSSVQALTEVAILITRFTRHLSWLRSFDNKRILSVIQRKIAQLHTDLAIDNCAGILFRH